MEKESKIIRELANRGREHGYDKLRFWPDSNIKKNAFSFHVIGNDRREEFEANVVFILGEYENHDAKLIEQILEILEEPIVLNVPLADSTNLQSLYNSLGFTLMPTRWTKNEREYEVFMKGSMKMGGFVNLMERVENIVFPFYNLVSVEYFPNLPVVV